MTSTSFEDSPAWQEMLERDRALEEKTPPTAPCPPWCVLPAGHKYESVENEGADVPTFSRFHSAYQTTAETVGDVTQEEWNTGGAVRFGPVVVSIGADSLSGLDELTVDQARARAAALVVLADRLEEIEQETLADQCGHA